MPLYAFMNMGTNNVNKKHLLVDYVKQFKHEYMIKRLLFGTHFIRSCGIFSLSINVGVNFQKFGTNVGVNFQKLSINLGVHFDSLVAHPYPKLGQVTPWGYYMYLWLINL